MYIYRMLLEFLWKWGWMVVGKNSQHSLELKKKKLEDLNYPIPRLKTVQKLRQRYKKI